MKIPVDVTQIIREYSYRFAIPNSETGCQDWTHNLCCQLKFSFPNSGWGHKSAGPDRPHSKDCICIENPFVGWDIIDGAGTSNSFLFLDGDSIDLTGQLFELVIAKSFLLPVPPIPPTPDGDVTLSIILKTMREFHDEEMEAITAARITRMA
jgi:hypothetical protein